MSFTTNTKNPSGAMLVVVTLLASFGVTGCATSVDSSASSTAQSASLNGTSPTIQLELRSVLPWALVDEETPFMIHLTNTGSSRLKLHDETVIEVTCKAGRDIYTQRFRMSDCFPGRRTLELAPGQSIKQEVLFGTKAITKAKNVTFQATLKTIAPSGKTLVQLTKTKPSKMKVLSEEQLAQTFGSIKKML